MKKLKLRLIGVYHPHTPEEETYYTDDAGFKVFGFKAGNLPWTWRVLKNDFGKKFALPIISAYEEALRKGGYETTEELEIVV